MRPRHLVSILLALVVVGAGTYGAVRFFAPATDHAIELVPRDAVAYASVFLRPSTAQRRALKDIIESFPTTDTDREAEDLLDELIGDLLEGSGLDYRRDVRPWLGTEIAAFALTPQPRAPDVDGAAIIATEDPDAAWDAVRSASTDEPLEERTYRGVDHVRAGDGVAGVLEDFLVIGSEGGFKATVDVALDDGEDSLVDSPKLEKGMAALTDDRLALFYIDSPALLSAVAAEEGIPPGFVGGRFLPQGPTTGVVFARSEELVIDTATVGGPERAGPSGGGDMLPEVSGRVWAGVGFDDLGDAIGELIDRFTASGIPGLGFALEQQLLQQTGLRLEEDLLSWMDDAAVFVQETNPEAGLGGGLAIRSSDPKVSTRAVNRLHGVLLGRRDVPVGKIVLVGALGERLDRKALLQGRSGFSIWEPGSPEPINVVADGDRVLIMYGAYATFDALNGGTQLQDVLSYEAARESMRDDFELDGFVSGPPLLEVLDHFPPPTANWATEVKPNLLSIAHVALGSRRENGMALHRVVVRVE
ncbi:MAG TPA: DUF3352 domain-containing protein [Actinomycetota bacterium]|nr:DUF3352 domain-containing protein [Actinomycetota bacterium]